MKNRCSRRSNCTFALIGLCLAPPTCLGLFLYFGGYFIYLEPAALPDLLCRWLNDPQTSVNKTAEYQAYMQLAQIRLTDANSKCLNWHVQTEMLRMQILSDIMVTPAGDLPQNLVSIIERHVWSFRSYLPINFVPNIDEMKPFLVAAKESDSCNIVTIGIGGDIGAETQMKRKMPHCKFFGADPTAKFGELYNEIGTYFPLAISKKEINKTSLVMTSKFRFYEREVLRHVSLSNFLLNYAKLPQVDLLLLDAEGAEYDLFPTLIREGQLERRGIIICQLSLELHGPLFTYANNMDNRQWTPLVTEFLLNTDLLPLWAYKTWPRHQIFLFNTTNEYCVRKYFPSFC